MARRTPKKSTSVGTPFRIAVSATLAAGSTPRTGTPRRQKMLEQISVIARKLDDKAVGSEAESLDNYLGVSLGVIDPRRRIGREVRVLFEDVLRADVFL